MVSYSADYQVTSMNSLTVASEEPGTLKIDMECQHLAPAPLSRKTDESVLRKMKSSTDSSNSLKDADGITKRKKPSAARRKDWTGRRRPGIKPISL